MKEKGLKMKAYKINEFQLYKAEQIDRLLKKIHDELAKKISIARIKQLDKRIDFLNEKSNQIYNLG
jgi:hypothetical protein